jgi:AraC-like DNA-binding protein/quercetin dioxygenase-like cupin family protein
MGTPFIATFHMGEQIYHADTCEPLKRAAERGEVQIEAYAHGAYPGKRLPEHMLPQVRAVGYWHTEKNQSWGLDWHRNEGIELTYLSRGKIHFGVDQQQFLLKRGDLTITRPWQAHHLGNPHIDASHLYWLILDVGIRRPNQTWNWPRWLVLSESDRAWLTKALSRNEHPVWEANDEIRYYFEKLGELAAETEVATTESRFKHYICGLLIALVDLLRQEQPPLDQSLCSSQRTVELFLANLPHSIEQSWDLDSMAAACGLGRSRFIHYCREITNMTPGSYLTSCRIQVARQLLLTHPEWSITRIAFRCGFGSSQYFATVFHDYVGCTPREFRLRHPLIHPADADSRTVAAV